MASGSLIHKVDNINNELVGSFQFPQFRDVVKDPTGQTQSMNAPLSNDPVFSDRLEFLKEKNQFLEKIFDEKFSLKIKFDFCESQQSADKKLSAKFCIKNGPFEINGISLQRVQFSIQNQVRTSLVGSDGQVAHTDVVYADLLFTTTSDAKGIVKAYRSSFTYYPNGNSIQCILN